MRKKLLFVHLYQTTTAVRLYQTTTAIGRTQNREKRKKRNIEKKKKYGGSCIKRQHQIYRRLKTHKLHRRLHRNATPAYNAPRCIRAASIRLHGIFFLATTSRWMRKVVGRERDVEQGWPVGERGREVRKRVQEVGAGGGEAEW